MTWSVLYTSNAIQCQNKEILVKIVTQAIPMYIMNVFKLPNTLCNEMANMDRKSCWGQTNERN